jgi:O-antigen/teichoic acid export membrane protein
MKVRRAFAMDFIVYALSRASVGLIWIALVSTLTSLMRPSEYAVFWQLFTLITGAAGIASSWLVTAFRRFYPQFVESNDIVSYYAAASFASRFCIISASLSFLLIFLVLAAVSEWGLGIWDIIIVPAAFVAALSFLIYAGHLIATRASRTFLFINTAQALMLLVLCTVLVRATDSDRVTLALVAVTVSYALGISYFVMTKERHLLSASNSKSAKDDTRKYLSFGLPLVIMNGAFLIANLGTQLIVSGLYSTEEAGIYAAFYSPIERIVGFAIAIAATALLPLLSSLWEKGRHSEALRLLFSVLAFVTMSAGGLSILLMIEADRFASMIIGVQFRSGAVLIPLTCASCILSGLAGIVADILIVQKKTRLTAALFVFASLLGLGLSAVLVPGAGAMGAVEARAVSSGVSLVLVLGAAVWILRQRTIANH